MWKCLVAFTFLASTAFGRRGGFGGGGHHYPHSPGLSGAGHNYPHSKGLSGTGYNNNARNSYPHSTGLSGTNNYRQTGHTTYKQKTEVHHHYYSPPQQIHYTGYSYHSLPVYHGNPPVYVYQYRNSGSPYNSLLAGLALYNLGRMSAGHSSYDRGYRHSPGEQCRLGIKKENGDYQETRVDCQIMSSFIIDAETDPKQVETVQTHQVVTSVMVNGAVVNQTSTTIVDALQVKGPPIQVTQKTQCYLIRVSSVTNMKKTVPCGLLQTYAQTSFRNEAKRLTPVIAILVSAVVIMVH